MESIIKMTSNKRRYFNALPKDAEFFGTPAYAIDPIIKYIPKHVKTIWEPTSGRCDIANYLKKKKYKVKTTDLYPQLDGIEKHNFLTDDFLEDYDMIILNPPFKQMVPFIKRLYEQDKPFMFIAPLHGVTSMKRQKVFAKHGINLILFDLRVHYLMENEKDRDHCPYYSSWFLGNVEFKNRFFFEQLDKKKKY